MKFKMKFFSIKNDTPASRQKVWVTTGPDNNPRVRPAVFEPGKPDDDWDHGAFRVIEFPGDDKGWPVHIHPDSDVLWAPWQEPGMDGPVNNPRHINHVGYDKHRLDVNYPENGERALAEAWVKQNADRGSSGFLGLLVPAPDQRDAKVAATIIQWLGTNIGSAFLASVMRQSPEFANYFTTAIGFSKDAQQREHNELIKSQFKALLQGISRVIPDLKEAKRGTDDYLLMQVIIELSQAFGMPHIEVGP